MSIRITYDTAYIDGSTVTASSYTGDLAPGNVINDQVNRPWRSTGVNTQWIKFDFTSARSFNVCGIFGHNFTAAATATLAWSTDDASWTDVGNFTILANSDAVVLSRLVMYFSAASKRYWRISIDNPTHPGTYLEIGRVILGTYYEPARNYADDYAIEHIDPSEEARTAGRDPIYRQMTIYRRATVRFPRMTETQRLKFQTIFLKVGNTRPMLVSFDPAATDPQVDSMYCSFLTPMRLISPVDGQWDALDLVFEERT